MRTQSSMITLFRQFLQQFSLRVQTILLMLSIGTVLSAAISYSVYRLDVSKIDEEIGRRSEIQAKLIQKLSLDALIAADRPALQTVTDGIKGLDIGLDRMIITNFEGDVLASWESEDAGEGKVYDSVTPIQYRGQNFGTLELSWNHQKIAAPMKARATDLAHTVIISISVLGLCFVVFVEFYFVKPLNYLKAKMEAFDDKVALDGAHQDFISGELRQLDHSLDEAVGMVRENAAKERELQEEKAKVKVAEAAASARTEFLSLMSHEIRTPLGAILGFAQLMESTRLNREQSSYVGQIRKSGAFLLTILNDILDLSKIEANRVELANDPFDLETLMDDLHSMSAPQARKKDLAFCINVSGETDVILEGDPHRIKQVLMNLCGNAIKFTEEGEVTVEVKAEVSSLEPVKTAHVSFSVSDTGIGMNPDQADKIFEPFSQADASISRRFGGTGLGVSISRELVTIMGGELKLETEEGSGSTFSFSLDLPILETGHATAEGGSRTPSEIENQNELEGLSHHHRLLVVEDDPANQLLIRRLLGCLDQKAEFAGDGQECMEILLRDDDFDAILLDLRMPKVSGIEVLQRVRGGEAGGKAASLPIAVMSADVLSRDEALEVGADDFIMKPIDVSRLRHFLDGVSLAATADIPQQVIPFPEGGIETASGTSPRPCGPRVMVAEDNPAVCHLMEKVLSKWGYRATFASDGEECLRELTSRHYDAIVSDLRMPNMDGITLISKIREGGAGENHRDTAIALMTAEAISQQDCLDASADAFIPKPIPMEKLRRFLVEASGDPGKVILSG